MWCFRSLLVPVLFGLVSYAAPAVAEQQVWPGLSADFLITDPANSSGGTTAGKLYLDGPGMRVENKMNGGIAVMIFDFARNTTILLDPQTKSYSEAARPDGGMGMMKWLFPRKGDPCGKGELGTVKTTKLGTETLNGRKVEKWRCVYKSSDGGAKTWTLWNDPSLPIPIRVDVDTGLVFALSNLVVTPQPAALFRVPAGYTRRADPQGPTLYLKRPN